MTKQTRATLKGYFNTSDTVTESNVADLIDTVYDGMPITYTAVTVAASGGDYTTVTAALDAITTNSETNRYIVLVQAGTYTENGPINRGLQLKDYVDIIGADPATTTLQSNGNSDANAIYTTAQCTVSNLTLHAITGARYAVHLDLVSNKHFTMRNCICTHADVADVLGSGGRAGYWVTVENCTITGNVGIHGDAVGRVLGVPWKFEFPGSTIGTMNVVDFLEYNVNTIDLRTATCGTITPSTDTSYYTANAGNPLYNRGYQMKSVQVIQ